LRWPKETGSWSPGRSRAASTDARLYLITGARPDLARFLEAAVRGGVDIVQIREKHLPDSELVPVLHEARRVTARLGVPLVVNDRPDLAALVGADYVHVGQDDLPVDVARQFGVKVGLSTHAPAEVDAADADYIGVGPVYATPTKAGRPAVGLELVRHAAEHARQPWFAIGGIDARAVGDVVAAGARRIAVVRAIGDAADPEQAAAELAAALVERKAPS
jgi:thiamine-phosphate pyrophosphorylase